MHAQDALDPIAVLKGLDCLAEFGKPLEITEATIPTLGPDEMDEDTQAEILKYLYTLWFSHPAMESIVYWNLVDDTAYIAPDGSWDENNCRGGLWHRDLTPKKSAIMLKKLIHEVWHTSEELQTDINGEVRLRGFYGDYVANIDEKVLSFGIHKSDSSDINSAKFILFGALFSAVTLSDMQILC